MKLVKIGTVPIGTRVIYSAVGGLMEAVIEEHPSIKNNWTVIVNPGRGQTIPLSTLEPVVVD